MVITKLGVVLILWLCHVNVLQMDKVTVIVIEMVNVIAKMNILGQNVIHVNVVTNKTTLLAILYVVSAHFFLFP